MYHGTLERQRQTAKSVIDCYEKFGREIPTPIISSAFNECDAAAVWNAYLPRLIGEDPTLENKMDHIRTDPKVFQKIFSRLMFRWVSGKYEKDRGPRWKDFTNRVTEGVHYLMKIHGSGSRIAVFTSGGPVALAIRQALNISDEKTMELSWQVMNASVTRMEYKGDKIALAGFNDITHLEMVGDEALLTYR
jgi:broad specificity phosphatase PhoE